MDLGLNNEKIGEERRKALSPAYGKTLEIGYGTGLNFQYYPSTVTSLSVIDSEQMLRKRVDHRIASSSIPIEVKRHDAMQRLPFESSTFDSVVTTLTLCSIDNPSLALEEIGRVLKPGGIYIFFEHGRSDDLNVARRQDRFNPVQRVVGAGCNLNRRMDTLIESGGLEIVSLERFLMPGLPALVGEMYRGTARNHIGA